MNEKNVHCAKLLVSVTANKVVDSHFFDKDLQLCSAHVLLLLTNKQTKADSCETHTFAATHSEAVGARRALVTAPANHVWFAATLTTHLAALSTQGTLRVTLAF